MSYMDRALKAKNPRYIGILEKLGYQRRDMTVSAEPVQENKDETDETDLTDLRNEYQEVIGKRAFHGWDADTLRAKIAEAKDSQ